VNMLHYPQLANLKVNKSAKKEFQDLIILLTFNFLKVNIVFQILEKKDLKLWSSIFH